jgi:hypothetical protein
VPRLKFYHQSPIVFYVAPDLSGFMGPSLIFPPRRWIMAVEVIGNHVQNLADQLFGQKRETPAGTRILRTGREGNGAATEDTFTPSMQDNSGQATAQDAGLFQVSHVALTEVTANFLFEQTAPKTSQNGAPAPGAPAAASDAGTAQAPAPNTNTPAIAAQQDAATPAAQAATGAAPTLTEQVQLQTLNAALPALGLSYNEIHEIDRIASLIHDFNPAAYSDLVNQFEALAQQAAQQSAALAAANAGAAASPNTPAGTSANGGGFQVQDVFIHFTGFQETVNNTTASRGGQGPASNNIQITASTLQIEQARFTLANGNGQTVQVQTPQQNTNEETKDRPASQTHLATA